MENLNGQKFYNITQKIKNLGGKSDSYSFFSREDQPLVCEAVAEATPVKELYYQEKERTDENVSVNGSVNGTYKKGVKFELNSNQLELISQLKQYEVDLPKQDIASLLESLFGPWPDKEGHWLWIAQTYTRRVINWVISLTMKEYLRGGIRKTPGIYFTFLIKHRAKRKQFTGTK